MTTYVIAEAGVNHNGSLDLAKELVDIAAECRADAVKFQTFKAESLVSKFAPKAEYQLRATSKIESQFEMLKTLELSLDGYRALKDHCSRRQIDFLSTPFDVGSLRFLVDDLNISRLKIPSGEITNPVLLLEAARSKKAIILSTGMSTLDEVEVALSVLAFGYSDLNEKPSMKLFQAAYLDPNARAWLSNNVTLLHCTTEYPAPFDEVNLRAMDTIRKKFQVPVGYSDHTPGITVPIAAVARGAVVIEKHFTLDKNLPGPDHKASLTPEELKAMVYAIREVELALGSSIKHPSPSELKNIAIARKSLVTAHAIKKGELFTPENLTIKRPGCGISAMNYYDWLDKPSSREYFEDELIT